MSEEVEVERWEGEAAPTSRRIGHAPDEIPQDGDWYVMRSSEWVPLTADRQTKRGESQLITQAVKYLRTRRDKLPGFEAKKVREENVAGGEVRWHMLGRWTI
jgi:hypothetical protein